MWLDAFDEIFSEEKGIRSHEFYFRKNWTAILLVPLVFFLYYNALFISWWTLRFLVLTARESVVILLVLTLSGVAFIPFSIGWYAPTLIGKIWRNNLQNPFWKRFFKLLIAIFLAVFVPDILMRIFSSALS